jgi:hypothetical protein
VVASRIFSKEDTCKLIIVVSERLNWIRSRGFFPSHLKVFHVKNFGVLHVDCLIYFSAWFLVLDDYLICIRKGK